MKINKLDRFEIKKQSAITPAEHRVNCGIVTDLIMEVINRLPENPQPVKETYAELLSQIDGGVPRQSTIIQSGVSENPVFKSAVPTKNYSGNDENSPKIVTETFTDEQKRILETLK